METYSGGALQRPATPNNLLRAGLETDPNGLALVSARTRLTWEEFEELSGRLAAGYLDLGLLPGDRIASLMPNRYETTGKVDRTGLKRMAESSLHAVPDL